MEIPSTYGGRRAPYIDIPLAHMHKENILFISTVEQSVADIIFRNYTAVYSSSYCSVSNF